MQTSVTRITRVLACVAPPCTGDADAYGTIADCYTDMGDLEKAAEFYDKCVFDVSCCGSIGWNTARGVVLGH